MWLEEKVKKYLLHIESGRIIYNLVIKHEYTPNRSVPFELNKQKATPHATIIKNVLIMQIRSQKMKMKSKRNRV